jgi:gamma-glutamyltranspeptidase/glutathione hydrolase
MTPTIVLRDGEPVVVVGTPGGSTIFTSVFQVILNLFDFGMSADRAVASTRFHHQLPDAQLIRYDNDRSISPELQDKLENYGYRVEANAWGTLGDVALVYRDAAGRLQAAADPRRMGAARLVPLPPRAE